MLNWLSQDTIEYEADGTSIVYSLTPSAINSIKVVYIIDRTDWPHSSNIIHKNNFYNFPEIQKVIFKVTKNTYIESASFEMCSKLKEVDFKAVPSNVTICFEKDCFAGTKIKKLIMPKSIINFQKDALKSINSLDDIVFSGGHIEESNINLLDINTPLKNVYLLGINKKEFQETLYLSLLNHMKFLFNNQSNPVPLNIRTDNSEIIKFLNRSSIKKYFKTIFATAYADKLKGIKIFED